MKYLKLILSLLIFAGLGLALFFFTNNEMSETDLIEFEMEMMKKYGLAEPSIEIREEKAFINGTLGKMFYDLFVKTLDENPEVKTIVLLDVPGSLNDDWNLKACLLVYEKGLNTELLSESIVESGGTDLFVSGRKLIIADGAKIGVHSWADVEDDVVPSELPKDHPEHKKYLDLYHAIGIDDAFYFFTLSAAPAEGMHYMTKNEINQYFGNKMN